MKSTYLIILLLVLFGCASSTPSKQDRIKYDIWSRYWDPNGTFLMYSRPRAWYETSTEISNGRYIDQVNLVNFHGELIKKWNVPCPIAHAELYKGFELMVACYDKDNRNSVIPPGSFEKLILLDSNSNLKFEYYNVLMHHSFFRRKELIFTIQNRELDNREKKKYGMSRHDHSWSDKLVQIDLKGNSIWEWDLIIDGKISPNLITNKSTSDIGHGNSIVYYDTTPLTSGPALLASFRNISSIFLIDYKTKKIVWRSPEKSLSYQHDASLTDQNKVLAFNNDVFSNNSQSEVVEFDLYSNDKKVIYKNSYFSISKMGAVQKLPPPNNNIYLITNSLIGFGMIIDEKENLLGKIWNKPVKKNRDIFDVVNDVEAYPFAPIYKIKYYNLIEVQAPE